MKFGASAAKSGTGALERAQEDGLQHLLNLIQEIRGDFQAEGLTVPGVVVCGDQSAGR